MMNNVKKRILVSSLISNKNLKAMLGEEDEVLEEDGIEETDIDLDDVDDADDYDDSELEDADTDEDELDLDDSDDEVDNEDGSEDEIDSDDDDVEVVQSDDNDWDTEEDDLLILKFNKRKPKLSEGEYMARIGSITAERQ